MLNVINAGPATPSRFNLLTVGERSSGKNTFLKAIVQKYGLAEVAQPNQQTASPDDVLIKKGVYEAQTSGGLIIFHLYSTNLGSEINNQRSIDKIEAELLKRQHDWVSLDVQLMTEEKRLQLDERIMLLVYFFAPHRFTSIDRQAFKNFSSLVPMVPVVCTKFFS